MEYVKKIGTKAGFAFGTSSGGNTAAKGGKSLKDFEPESTLKGTLQSIQKAISELGYDNLYQLLMAELEGFAETDFSDAEKITGAIENLKNKWGRKSATKADIAQKKANINKICVSMQKFFRENANNAVSLYADFLTWLQLSEVLLECFQDTKRLKRDSLNEESYNLCVEDLREVSGKITLEDARSVLNAYCAEKGIGIPKQAPNLALCPHCQFSFEKKSPLPDECPVCHESFKVKCPKCGKEKHMLETPVCDGIELLRFPVLKRKLKKAEELIDRIKLAEARYVLDEIDDQWKGFPGSDSIRRKYDLTNAGVSKAVREIDGLCENNRYVTAKRTIEKYVSTYPELKNRYSMVYGVLEDIKKQKALYQKETAPDKKEAIAASLGEMITDDLEINSWLPKVENIDSLQVSMDNRGHVNLSWSSKNKPNSVTYYVRRKENSAPGNCNDGTEVMDTKNPSAGDTVAEEGKAIYYGVYAQRGDDRSNICTKGPVVLLKTPEPRVTVREDGADITWSPSVGEMCVFYSRQPISKFGEGEQVKNISQQGCRIDGLIKGTTYYLYIAKRLQVFGQAFCSEGASLSFVPIEKIDFPEVTKTMGQAEDEYIISYCNYSEGCSLNFYYSESENVQISQRHEYMLSELTKKLMPIAAETVSVSQYRLRLDGRKKICVFPAVVRGGTAFVGSRIILMHIDALHVTDIGVSGDQLYLRIDRWPEGADCVAVSYSGDAYPDEPNDGVCKDVIHQKNYEKDEALYLKHNLTGEYYFSFFARRNGEYLPVGNYYYNPEGVGVTVADYSFAISLLGAISLKIKTKNEVLPPFELILKEGSIPISVTDGTPAEVEHGTSSDGVYSFKVKNVRARAGLYAKLFPIDANTEFRIKGRYELKKK